MIRTHLYPTMDALLFQLSKTIVRIADRSIADRGVFSIVLTGGRSAEKLYHELSIQVESFNYWDFWFSDERNLPLGHSARNSKMVLSTLLDNINGASFHPIPYHENLQMATQLYSDEINKNLNSKFDFVLLSLGEDGHIASLFPDRDNQTNKRVIAVEDAPKYPPNRISLTADTLTKCHNLIIMVAGKGKRAALRNWLSGVELPVASLNPKCGVDIYTDQCNIK